ncbi:hypothetical protein HFD88_002578 [Aspergillus terreus]|nr:hypothetical protein HFD88_002578 [Aspergillus terreus]
MMDEVPQYIPLTQAAVDAIPDNHIDWARFFDILGQDLEQPKWPAFLNHLAQNMNDLYLENNDLSDLEEAIKLTRGAVHLSRENDADPDYPGYLNNLANLLGDRYIRTGSVGNLEESIAVAQQAINAIPKNHPNRPKYLNNLGNQLNDRYLITGVLADLDEAIQVGWEAIRLTPEDHIHRPALFNNLGNRLGDRYLRTDSLGDLDEAIRIKREAVKATPENHPDRAGRLNNLAIELSARYLKTFDPLDIEMAIQAGREAIRSTPAGHADLTMYLHSLGNSLDYSADASNLEEAVQVGRAAVNATPRDHPDSAMALNSLGKRLSERFLKTGASCDLDEAISCHHGALYQENASTIHRIVAGRAVIKLCASRQDWLQGYTAAETALDLVPKLTMRSLENSDKQYMLGQVVGLASEAAAVALNAHRTPLVALGFLEQGRALLAASLEEMRTDILELQERCPQLAREFIHLRDQLEPPVDLDAASLLLSDENEKKGQSFEQAQADARHKAASNFDRLVAEIRQQPGMNDFLLPPSTADMQTAARKGPIVLVNVSDYRCDAILIEQHRIRSLPLPTLHNVDVKKRAQSGDLASLDTLGWLWTTIAHPILHALGLSQPPSANDDWPHIWWIPTGFLTKFALHAAGRYKHVSGGSGTGGVVTSYESVLDRAMSSYSSSVKAIIHGRRRAAATSPSTTLTPGGATTTPQKQALLVAIEHTLGASPLPFAAEEIRTLHPLCASMGLTPISSTGGDRGAVQTHLPRCKIFHFAGHGYTDTFDPSKSHLRLRDGQVLCVADLLAMNIRGSSPFLAYLSACGTGRIRDDRFVDESIHLISGFQLAGFRHVIGTLWDVNDEICVDVARITYEKLRDRGGCGWGLEADEALCRGLHEATRTLRERWLRRVGSGSRRGKVDPVRNGSLEGSPSVLDGQHGSRLQRDVDLCDDDEEEEDGEEGGNRETAPALWVPYVHFGV